MPIGAGDGLGDKHALEKSSPGNLIKAGDTMPHA
jgi:hypothetical protein